MGRGRAPLEDAMRALSEAMQGVARGQSGVITAAQCGALGVDATAIRRLVSSGEWRRIRRGVYGDTRYRSRDSTGHLRRCAAVLAGLRSTEAVVSHVSAARLLGLPLPPNVDPAVTLTRRPPAPTRGPRGAAGIAVGVHLARYDDADVVRVDGVPVLAGARVVLDCCSAVPPDSALAIADAALARGMTSPEHLRDAVARQRGRPGTRLARLVVDERSDQLAESWFESSSRWWLLEAGLPRPRLQVPFMDGTGLVRARVDMLIGDVVGEADGAGKYDSGDGGAAVRARLRPLQPCGLSRFWHRSRNQVGSGPDSGCSARSAPNLDSREPRLKPAPVPGATRDLCNSW